MDGRGKAFSNAGPEVDMSKEMVLRNGNVAGIPAAQYIRMSTEHQRYSPDNQKAAIASFADARGFEVVKTYLDAGKSGLSLARRDGLQQLLSDVISGEIKHGRTTCRERVGQY